jgi:hypothetical protein
MFPGAAVDRTHIDRDLVSGNPAGWPILNGRALDITRRSFSTVRVVRGDAWGGVVIVKGKLNYFGKLERGRSAIRHSEASKA